MIGWSASLALLAVVWLLFAPTQVGGSTSYAITDGVSMLPRLHSGDLALMRGRSSYKVGDAVLYNSPVLHRPVLHRIVAIHEGRYSLKGDNNNFVDPGTVGANAIVGGLWFYVPHVGGWVGWLTEPLHAAILAVAAALILLLGGTASRSRRSRRRGSPERPVAATVLAGPALGPVTPGDFMLRGVNLHRAWQPVAGLMLFALLLAAVAFAVPSHRNTAAPGAFRQLGDFSYVGTLATPNAAYPEGVAQTGDPLLLELFRDVNVRFNYQFNTRLPHRIKGTIALNTIVSAATTWHRTFPLQKPVAFEGDAASIGGAVDLVASRAFFDQLSADSGAVGADYLVDLQAVVTITGVVGGKPVHETFKPILPFTLNHQLIKLAVPTSSTTAGGDYTAPTTGLAAILNPEQVGSVAHRVANTVTVARFRVDVMALRIAGLLLIALTVAAMVALAIARPPIRARREQDLIGKRYGHLLVPVVAVNPDGRKAVEVADFHSLVRVAQNYEHLILEEHHGRISTYAVDEDGRLYVYRIDRLRPGGPGRATTAEVPVLPRASHAPALPAMVSAVPARKLARPVGLLCLLAAALTIFTGFTASNTVPVTYAGKTTKIPTEGQLAPSLCASLQLTNTIVASSGATSVTGTSENDLIIGPNRKGTVNYNGQSGSDCIVAGGGSGTLNIIDGGSGSNDICIGAPGASNTFKHCDRSYG